MRSVIALAAAAVAASVPSLVLAGQTQDAQANEKGFHDVKMSVVRNGSGKAMSARMRQAPGGVAVIITQGGNTTPHTVRIVDAGCPALGGKVLYTLPPFHGNEYQAVAKSARVDDLFAGKKALVIVGSDGRHATDYACGNLTNSVIVLPPKLQ